MKLFCFSFLTIMTLMWLIPLAATGQATLSLPEKKKEKPSLPSSFPSLVTSSSSDENQVSSSQCKDLVDNRQHQQWSKHGLCSTPPFAKILAVALEKAELGQEQIESIKHRVHWAPFLPTLSARIAKTDSQGEYLGLNSDTPDKVTLNNYLALKWEIRATWDLSQLIFEKREINILVQARQIGRERQRFIEYISNLYFERCRLWFLVNKCRNNNLEDIWRKRLQLEQMTALLNTYSQGHFSKELSR